jgi:hypothetical protein
MCECFNVSSVFDEFVIVCVDVQCPERSVCAEVLRALH